APQRYMNEETRHEFFVNYLQLVAQVQRLDQEISRTYADPDIEDPGAVTAELRAQLAELREMENDRQLIAEAILEEQVSSVLIDEGFSAIGEVLPAVSSHFTPLPMLLIVSSRDRIERVYSLNLQHGLNTAEQEEIEATVDTDFDVSSLVTRIGGLSAYPAMLLESSSPNWVMEVTAHEWTHHYLAPRRLGWNYDTSAETRTLNETVANIVGKEISGKVIARYYPEFEPAESSPPSSNSEKTPEPPAFDFRAEMHETRIKVDLMLAAGEIEEAEDYMEERRQVFVENGYWIRKLNQAYFAFHGAYADEPGAAGEDPVGPAVRRLREQSPDPHTFVRQMSRMTTFAELQELLDEDQETQ
ncbi:MAG: hypothetical protein MUQ10_20305, partial [Anaerolineae bacterium]|nr:hypothetical protein [Anaerolineae bacterium]